MFFFVKQSLKQCNDNVEFIMMMIMILGETKNWVLNFRW